MALSAAALEVGERVDNFELLDQHGQAHELHYFSDAPAVVLMAHANECAAFAGPLSKFEATAAAYGDRGVKFLLVNSEGAMARRSAIQAGLPVLIDDTGVIGESLGVVAAGEALVVDTERLATGTSGRCGCCGGARRRARRKGGRADGGEG